MLTTSSNPKLIPFNTKEMLLPLIVLGGLIVVSTLMFWFSDLDVRCAAMFYAPPPATDPWPQELYPVWRLFYYGAPILAVVMAVGATATLLITRKHSHWRQYALYLLLTLAVGPGLLVNLVFKDHWGRPRPRQIITFGGTLPYLPPLALGSSPEEKSFPAGHASIGFSLCAFWFLWRRRYPRRAWLALGCSTALGITLGTGRIAAGAHFLSDVIWAGFISFLTALILYYFVLRIPQYPTTQAAPTVSATNKGYCWPTIYTSIGLLVVAGALLGFPVHEDINYQLPREILSLPSNLHLNLRYANVTIHMQTQLAPDLYIIGKIRGFGLPNYKIDSHSEMDNQTNTLTYTLKQRGFFTELDTNLDIAINISQLRRLDVQVQEGNIRVLVDKGIVVPQLELKTHKGTVTPLIYCESRLDCLPLKLTSFSSLDMSNR